MSENEVVTYYSHTQEVKGQWPTVAAVAGGAAIWAFVPAGFLARLAFLGLTAATATTFREMTINVDSESLNFSFANGFFKKSFPLSKIKSVSAMRTTPLQGWGIHYIGKGWLYNVWGLDAVEVVLDGGKHVYLGTDQPAELEASINQHCTGSKES